MKMLLAGISGGLILFFWGFLSWVVLHVHTASTRTLPNEDAVVATLQSSVHEKGVYLFPSMGETSADPAVQKQREDKYRRGPIGMIYYDPNGMEPFMPSRMVIGILIEIVASLIVAWFLARSTAFNSSYLARVAYCGMFGVFLVVAANLLTWNWFNEPNDWTTALIIDNVVGWILAGLAIAAFMKPLRATAQI